MAPVAVALGLAALARAGAAHLRIHQHADGDVEQYPTLKDTDSNLITGDFTRGHQPQRLYPKGSEPGERKASGPVGSGLPAFDPSDLSASREQYVLAGPDDNYASRCAPKGLSFGHYFYNVLEPMVVKFVVPFDAPNRKDTAVLVAPGGGGEHLEWEPEGTAIAEWLNSVGISAFVLKYRVPDASYELMLSDAQRAMSLLRSQADRLNLNPNRIGFAGFDAGGSIGLWLGNRAERSYARIDEIDDVDFRANFLILGYPQVFPSDFHAMQLVPPTFLTFAEDDVCFPMMAAHAWARELKMRHNTTAFAMKNFVVGKHGWATCELYTHLKRHVVCTWKKHAIRFLMDNGLVDRDPEA